MTRMEQEACEALSLEEADELSFHWGETTLGNPVVRIVDVDEGETLDFVVFNTDEAVLTAFEPPFQGT